MPPAPRTGAGVVQRLFMFTYPAGTIVNTAYTEEEAEGLGKVAVTHMGVTVYADERNVASTRLEIERRFLAGTLNAVPSLDQLDELDQGLTHPRARLYKLKTFNPSTIAHGAGVFVPGKVFYRIGEGALHHVTEALIDRYWDLKYSGFRRTTHPDWRYNCWDWALNRGEQPLDDPGPYLDQHFEQVANLATCTTLHVQQTFQATAGVYVVRVAWHYIRFTVTDANVTVSQKDGESAVYETTMAFAAAAEYARKIEVSVRLLYRKKA
jgi:hypothetical protein